MKKILLGLLLVAGGFVALLISAVIFLPKFINVESYIPEIEQKVAEATGRPFTLGRDFDVSVFPWAGVSFSNLSLGNPTQFGGGDFVKVRSFQARVKLLPLLSKKIEVEKFVVDGPEIHLIKSADGRTNWSMEKKGQAGDSEPGSTNGKKEPAGREESSDLTLSSLEVGEFSVTNGLVVYTDKSNNQTRQADSITLKLEDVSLERPVSLLFQANVDGKPVSVEGQLGPIGVTPGKGTVGIDLVIKAMEQLDFSLKGEIVEPATDQKFRMNLKVASFSPRRLLESLNVELPVETADPAVLNKVSADLNVEGDARAIRVHESRFVLDDSSLTLSAEVKEMASPDVSFKLVLDSINLDRYLPPPVKGMQEESAPSQAAVATPETPATQENTGAAAPVEVKKINYEPLRKLVLSGELHAGELVAHGAKVQQVEVKIVGRNGVFDLQPCRLDLYKGEIGVIGNFNLQNEQPAGKIDFKANAIQVGPLLKDAAQKDLIEGSMSVDAAITFTGDKAETIKKSLNGGGSLTFLDGALVGIDLAEMGRSFASGMGYQKPEQKPKTDFAELSVPFTLVNGVFETRDTSLISPLLRMKAFGTADLVNEQLHFKVQPKIVGTLKGQGDAEERSGVTVPILVEGTFAEPEYSADLSALASEEAIEEALRDPEGTKKKLESLEETGKGLLQSFGFGKKK